MPFPWPSPPRNTARAGRYGTCAVNSGTPGLLFGSPAPPLDRRAFIRAALWVLIVGGIVFGLGLWLESAVGEDLPENIGFCSGLILVGLIIALACVYLIPYFRVMHRRLLAVGFPFPARLVAAAVVCLMAFNMLLSREGDWRWYAEAVAIAVDIAVYLALLPWPDRLPGEGREPART